MDLLEHPLGRAAVTVGIILFVVVGVGILFSLFALLGPLLPIAVVILAILVILAVMGRPIHLGRERR